MRQLLAPLAPLALLAAAVLSGCADASLPPLEPERSGPTRAPARAIAPGPYTPGQSYFGRNQYIEYVAGNAPVIYSAPHGGTLAPSEIPDRTSSSCGESIVTSADLNTADLARRMQQAHFARFGTYPHVIVNNLHRRKLDANRPRLAAACGDAEAQIAYDEWHDFMAVARSAVLQATGKGWYMDMHGHGHEKQRLELGYLTTGAQLRLSDATLDATAAYEDTASFHTVSELSPLAFSALLRGTNSLGTLYANGAFPAVPSSSDPAPASGDSYFSGGYNATRYGCGAEASGLGGTSGGNICGVQIEANYTGVRDTETNRQRFAEVTAVVMEQYLGTHWGIQLGGAPPANVAPTASFTASCSGLTCTFTDASTDADGAVTGWSWAFGDGATATAQHPTRTYAAAGTYTVTLTATDDDGATGIASQAVTVTAPSGITLSARGTKTKGSVSASLSWSGASASSVDVYRNGALVATTPNDGAHVDALGKVSGTFAYRVCNAGTATCSNDATVTF